MAQFTTPLVKNVLILDSEGERILCKYYETDERKTLEAQHAYEKAIHQKTSKSSARSEADIIIFEHGISVFIHVGDVAFFVTGSVHENEMVLEAILNGLVDSLARIFKDNVEKRMLIENMDILYLTIDEIIDHGIVLETDPDDIVARVSLRGTEGDGPSGASEVEQTVSRAVSSAKSVLARFVK